MLYLKYIIWPMATVYVYGDLLTPKQLVIDTPLNSLCILNFIGSVVEYYHGTIVSSSPYMFACVSMCVYICFE